MFQINAHCISYSVGYNYDNSLSERLILLLDSIIRAVIELNEDKVINLVKYHIVNGENVLDIINSINAGMLKVGELYESKEFYVADLIMAGIIFNEILELDELKASFNSKDTTQEKPLILVGTVKDDVHDIGKKIFSGLATANGFNIIDLGVDVDPKAFLDNYYCHSPDIVAMSGLMTASIRYMKAVVDLFREKGLSDKVKIIVGGSQITDVVFDYIEADGYSQDAKKSVEICTQWIKDKRGNTVE
jgi:trimethylamine corrinoid protein